MNDHDELQEMTEAVRRQQRFPREPKRFADVLSRLLSRRGYAQVQTSAALENAWEAAAGTRWQTKTRVGRVQRGTLDVVVKDSAVMQELSFQQALIVRKINELAPELKVKKLRLRVGDVGNDHSQ